MLHKLKIGSLIFLTAILSGVLFAQKSERVQLLKYEDNSIVNISSITKDNSNFVWLTTQDGVYRFDSKNFLRIPILNKHTTENWTAIRSVCYNKQTEKLVIISLDKGLAVLNNHEDSIHFEKLELPSGIIPQDLQNIESFHNGFILFTLKGAYIIDIQFSEKTRNYVLNVPKHLPQIRISLETKINNTRFAYLDQDTNTVIIDLPENLLTTEISRLPSKKILSGLELFSINWWNNMLLVGTSSGLIILTLDENNHFSEKKILADQSIFSLTAFKDEVCIAADKGIYKLLGDTSLIKLENNSTDINDDWLKTVYAMYNSNNKGIWLGTQNGLALIDDLPNSFFKITNTTRENKALNHVYHLGGDQNNRLIISAENGLFALDNDQKELISIAPDNTYYTNFPAPDHKQMASDRTTTYVIQNNKAIPIETIYPEFKAFRDFSFNDYEYYNDSVLFLSIENNQGVISWNYKTRKIKPLVFADYREIGQTNTLYRYKDNLFILTDSTILTYNIPRRSLSKSTIINPETGMYYALFFDMIRIKDQYYITSYGNGLIVTDTAFRLKKVIDVQNGLSDNGTYRILSVNDTCLYVSTNNGINIIYLRDYSIRSLHAEDGLHNNIFEEFSSFQLNNKFYFGGKGGVTEIDPARISFRNSMGSLLFTNYVTISERSKSKRINLLDKNRITIDNNIVQITINFQNIVYPSNNQVRYYYKIKEINDNWIDQGNRNFVDLIDFPPNTYHLQIKTKNQAGIESEVKEIIITILPKWYQTWWFKSLIALLFIATVYSLYRLRISQLKKEHAIRTKLANDLHDDIGSTLNSVKVYSNLALMERGEEKHIHKIKQSIQEAITGIRDMIWVLDDKKNTISDLLYRIDQFIQPLCEANNIRYAKDIDDTAAYYKLTQEEKRNLYMILKEAGNNVIKYAEASALNIRVEINRKNPVIIISDNGKGFHTDSKTDGHGLKNMRYRATQIKYQLTVHTAISEGTKIELRKI